MRKLMFTVRNQVDGYGVDLSEVPEEEPQYVLRLQLFGDVALEQSGQVMLDHSAVLDLHADLTEFLRELV